MIAHPGTVRVGHRSERSGRGQSLASTVCWGKPAQSVAPLSPWLITIQGLTIDDSLMGGGECRDHFGKQKQQHW